MERERTVSRITPAQKIAEQVIMARRRPWRLVRGQMAKQPIRAAACWMPTAMELMRVASASVKLKSVWKEGKVRTPP